MIFKVCVKLFEARLSVSQTDLLFTALQILHVCISFLTGSLESHRKYNAKKPQTAVQHDYPAMVKELLVHGADPHASNA